MYVHFISSLDAHMFNTFVFNLFKVKLYVNDFETAVLTVDEGSDFVISSDTEMKEFVDEEEKEPLKVKL